MTVVRLVLTVEDAEVARIIFFIIDIWRADRATAHRFFLSFVSIVSERSTVWTSERRRSLAWVAELECFRFVLCEIVVFGAVAYTMRLFNSRVVLFDTTVFVLVFDVTPFRLETTFSVFRVARSDEAVACMNRFNESGSSTFSIEPSLTSAGTIRVVVAL